MAGTLTINELQTLTNAYAAKWKEVRGVKTQSATDSWFRAVYLELAINLAEHLTQAEADAATAKTIQTVERWSANLDREIAAKTPSGS